MMGCVRVKMQDLDSPHHEHDQSREDQHQQHKPDQDDPPAVIIFLELIGERIFLELFPARILILSRARQVFSFHLTLR